MVCGGALWSLLPTAEQRAGEKHAGLGRVLGREDILSIDDLAVRPLLCGRTNHAVPSRAKRPGWQQRRRSACLPQSPEIHLRTPAHPHAHTYTHCTGLIHPPTFLSPFLPLLACSLWAAAAAARASSSSLDFCFSSCACAGEGGEWGGRLGKQACSSRILTHSNSHLLGHTPAVCPAHGARDAGWVIQGNTECCGQALMRRPCCHAQLFETAHFHLQTAALPACLPHGTGRLPRRSHTGNAGQDCTGSSGSWTHTHIHAHTHTGTHKRTHAHTDAHARTHTQTRPQLAEPGQVI